MTEPQMMFDYDEENPPTEVHHVVYDCESRKTFYRLDAPGEKEAREKAAAEFVAKREAEEKKRTALLDKINSSNDPTIKAMAELLGLKKAE